MDTLRKKVIDVKKVRLEEAKPYDAPGHFKMIAFRLQHKETTGVEDFWVGLSHFLPGGGAEMSASDFEKVYVMLSGKNDCCHRRWQRDSFRTL